MDPTFPYCLSNALTVSLALSLPKSNFQTGYITHIRYHFKYNVCTKTTSTVDDLP